MEAREVMRRVGFRGCSEIRPEISSLVLELMASIESSHLLEPAVAYKIYPITEMGRTQLSVEGNTVIRGSLFPSVFPEAKELAGVVCTIGPKLEKQVTDCMNSDGPLRAVLLDGIGSAAVESLTEEVCKLITAEASSLGYQASSPMAPGMPGLPITEQWPLFEMVPAQEIGVSLTSSGIMVPQKSASMVIGLGPQMKTWTRAEVCGRCSLRQTCSYRIDG
jgi:hypothetical protein